MSRVRSAGTRIGTFLLAMLFLLTALGFSAAVIWQIQKDNKNAKELEAVQALTEKQNKVTPPKEENALEGTALQNFTPRTAPVTKLEIIDTVVGTGAVAKAGDTITAHYTGAVVATGIIFQSSHDGANQPIPFSLNGVIKGWSEGVPGMKVGGTRRLLIPATLAYGASPPSGSGIPANADLVFDIELAKIGE